MADVGRRSGWSEVYAKTPVVAADLSPFLTHQQKLQNRRGSGSILKILSMCVCGPGRACRAADRRGHASTIYIVRLK